MVTAGSNFTNGTNNYLILDIVPPDYPFPQVLKEHHKEGTAVIENLKTHNRGYMNLAALQARIECKDFTIIEAE